MRYLIKALASVPLLAVVLAGPAGLYAQELQSVFAADANKLKLAQASQQRIDKVVDETRSLEDQYRAVMKEIDGLEVYNTLLERQITNQEREMANLGNSIDQVTVIERQIMPLMGRMITGLKQFIELDVPFLPEERAERVTGLELLLERSDVTAAEKFRRVMEAYEIENEYGRTIETYKGELELGGGTREVDFLKIGRVALLYQTSDASFTGAWDNKARDWQELSGGYRNQVRQGLRMARKQTAPDLLLLPVPAPEDAE